MANIIPKTFFGEEVEDDDNMSDDLKVESKKVLEQACEFFLSGDVNKNNCDSIATSMLKMAYIKRKKAKKPTFVLNINSTGGSVSDGYMLAGTIQRVKAQGFEVHTRVCGIAASMGFILAQFGSKRIMDALATAHIHDVQAYGGGDTGYHEDFTKFRMQLRNYTAKVFASRNSAGYNDPEWWLNNFLDRKNHYLTAQEALDLGLIDEIVGSYPTAADIIV
jgi:ATP-dependent protease ClpP protease subunit